MEIHVISLLFLGDANCGKTTFLSRISQCRPNLTGTKPKPLPRDADKPFVFEIRSRIRVYRLELFNTGSSKHWKLLRPDLVILCYDISQRGSLFNLQEWMKQVRTTFQNSDVVPVLVLGLKRDLRSGDEPDGVHLQEALRVAQQVGADKYMECSAVTGELLTEVFKDLCNVAIATTTDAGGQSTGTCDVM